MTLLAQGQLAVFGCRYLALCHPVWAQTVGTVVRAKWIMADVWGACPSTACSDSSWWTLTSLGATAYSVATRCLVASTCPSTFWTSLSSLSHPRWWPPSSVGSLGQSCPGAPCPICPTTGAIRPGQRQELRRGHPMDQARAWWAAASDPKAFHFPGSR